MTEKPFLARLVVVRRYEQRAIDAMFLGGLGVIYGVLRGV